MISNCNIFRLPFRDDYYVEFGKQSQDKVLGTKDYSAHVSHYFNILIKYS